MSLEWEQVVVATREPAALGRWWCEALGWVIVDDDPVVFEIQPAPGQLPGILFLTSDDTKQGHNRLHIDLRPDDQAAEVERLIGMGASRVDIGQGDVPWVVLADPEGNEFCVLGPRRESTQGLPLAELVRISERLPDADLGLRTTLLARRREIRSQRAGRYRSTSDERVLQIETELSRVRDELTRRGLTR